MLKRLRVRLEFCYEPILFRGLVSELLETASVPAVFHEKRMEMSPVTTRDIVPGEFAIDDASYVAIDAAISPVQTERDGNVPPSEEQASGEGRVRVIGLGAREAVVPEEEESPLGFSKECG